MQTVFGIIVAIFAFGVMIFLHELGHYLAARACKVKVLEACHGAIPHVGDELVTTIHAVMTGLGEEGVLLFVELLIIPGNALL